VEGKDLWAVLQMTSGKKSVSSLVLAPIETRNVLCKTPNSWHSRLGLTMLVTPSLLATVS
jgi:hypothetical protein